MYVRLVVDIAQACRDKLISYTALFETSPCDKDDIIWEYSLPMDHPPLIALGCVVLGA